MWNWTRFLLGTLVLLMAASTTMAAPIKEFCRVWAGVCNEDWEVFCPTVSSRPSENYGIDIFVRDNGPGSGSGSGDVGLCNSFELSTMFELTNENEASTHVKVSYRSEGGGNLLFRFEPNQPPEDPPPPECVDCPPPVPPDKPHPECVKDPFGISAEAVSVWDELEYISECDCACEIEAGVARTFEGRNGDLCTDLCLAEGAQLAWCVIASCKAFKRCVSTNEELCCLHDGASPWCYVPGLNIVAELNEVSFNAGGCWYKIPAFSKQLAIEHDTTGCDP